jgi:4-hydroxybenzoate polyprenyltransferase
MPSQRSDRPTNRGAVAGSLLVATIILCTLVGLGLGALIGASAPMAIAGVFIGLVLGFVLVYQRFKDI